jgi:Glycosyltransferase WbsX
MIQSALLLVTLLSSATAAPLAAWEFDTASDGWTPNSHLGNVVRSEGVLSADGTGSDPFFTCKELAIEATPCQYVVIRLKADKPGSIQFFWSGQTEGPHGGFSSRKVSTGKVSGDGAWHEVVLFPFWHTEGVIRQLRFDVYTGAHFDIDHIRIHQWGDGAEPQAATYAWPLAGDTTPWQVRPDVPELFAPPLRLDVADKGWASIRLKADADGVGAVLWADAQRSDLHSEPFAFKGGDAQLHNIELQGIPGWGGTIVAFGIRLPADPATNVRIESIAIADRPEGPADVQIDHFGFENAVNRAQRPCRVVARLLNRGGADAAPFIVNLALPKGVELLEGTATRAVKALGFGERVDFAWELRADRPGPHTIMLACAEGQTFADAPVALDFAPPLPVQQADYVPEPRPVDTDLDVLAYYFPGWYSDVKWDPIRHVAPIRKPLLGYYDEANPECVDWQIKWAAENGITCFLVDWYWTDGNKRLMHWFEAYRKARYREHLDVAIMWANHNAPGTHSAEDWRNVTQEWIDRYFNLDTYYRIDGKPAVFLWAPTNIRNDLGGSEAVRASFDESQAMAKAAGYKGITFVALGYGQTADRMEMLAGEGYTGFTTYHEWGNAVEMSEVPKRAKFSDVAATAHLAWQEHEDMSGPLTYYPVVDTGWDSRPWHGTRALAILGRTPDHFEKILRDAKVFCRGHGKRPLILGPVNEWGEGSYVEPCTEFGFDMYERIRAVFATGDPSDWPVNVAPVDVGLGPYDYPRAESRTQWGFNSSSGGWIRQMGTSDLLVEDGVLRFDTTHHDPALCISTGGLNAGEFSKVLFRMRITGAPAEGQKAQLFWAPVGKIITEASSLAFDLKADGEMHEYTLVLGEHPRWRGAITLLRFDPCGVKDAHVAIDEIRFEE